MVYNKYLPKMFFKKFDGGIDSGVTGYMLIEWKKVFSIGILHFKKGTRDAFHNHAFNAITWWLKGSVTEELTSGARKDFKPSIKPKVTKRDCYHKVIAHLSSWAITFRGPWNDTWNELRSDKELTLTHGREIV